MQNRPARLARLERSAGGGLGRPPATAFNRMGIGMGSGPVDPLDQLGALGKVRLGWALPSSRRQLIMIAGATARRARIRGTRRWRRAARAGRQRSKHGAPRRRQRRSQVPPMPSARLRQHLRLHQPPHRTDPRRDASAVAIIAGGTDRDEGAAGAAGDDFERDHIGRCGR